MDALSSAGNSAITAQAQFAISQAAGPSLNPAERPQTPEAVKQAAQKFEAVFLGQMFSQMWTAVERDPLFGGGHSEEVYRDLLNREYGKSVARNGGIGLADEIAREMIRIQEGARQ